MKNKRDDITNIEIGKRLRQEAKRNGYTNQMVADLINYSSSKQISPIYSGKKAIDNDRIEKLANAFNVRKEYLLCEDDFPTENDILKNINEADAKVFFSVFSFLRSLGFIIDYIDTRSLHDLFNLLTDENKKSFWEMNKEIPKKDILDIFDDDILRKKYEFCVVDEYDNVKVENLAFKHTNSPYMIIRISKNNLCKCFTEKEFVDFCRKISNSIEFILKTFY